MCGIAGLYNITGDKNANICANIGQKMAAAIAHRGPEAMGLWQDPNNALTFIHQRLAIIDLSADGEQPMHSPSGRYVVTYNGEIYNYLDLKKELESLGHKFRTKSDTEVMLTAFEEWGVVDGVKKLNGMFAIALWDKKQKQLHLLRDRFGKKPLYFGWVGNDFVFASELKSFHTHPDFTAEVSRENTALYMQYGYVCAPHSIFKNIWQLLPGSLVTLDFEKVKLNENLIKRQQKYWDLADVVDNGKANISQKSEVELINEFENMLEHTVKQRMISDVPLGAFLSGGIDSSTVVALMQKNSAQAVKTFSIGFNEADYNEAEHAKKIAHHLGTDHHEFYVSAEEALNVISSLPDIYDEPFSDASQIPTYLISKLAKDKVTVALTGDGGDEILGGYRRHTHVATIWDKVKFLPYPMRKVAGSAFVKLLQNNPSKKRLVQLMSMKDDREIYHALISHGAGASDIVKNANLPSIPLDDIYNYSGDLNFSEKMIYGDMIQYRSDDLMVKTDRASMTVALETRAPLMDYKLAEYAWTLPHHMKIRGVTGKYILREVLKRHIPQNLYERPKMGFTVPIEGWLRGSLKDWASDLLSANNLNKQDILDADKVQKIWTNFQSGSSSTPNQAKYIWSILMYQAWSARWINK